MTTVARTLAGTRTRTLKRNPRKIPIIAPETRKTVISCSPGRARPTHPCLAEVSVIHNSGQKKLVSTPLLAFRDGLRGAETKCAPNEASRDRRPNIGRSRQASRENGGAFRRTRLESRYRIRQRRSYASHPTSIYRDFENPACGSLFGYRARLAFRDTWADRDIAERCAFHLI